MSLTVQQPWFDWIRRGNKTTEGRCGALGDRDSLLNTIVDIKCGIYTCQVYIESIKHYDSLDTYLLGEEGKVSTPHHNKEYAKYLYSQVISNGIMIFSDSEVKRRGGINALHLRVV